MVNLAFADYTCGEQKYQNVPDSVSRVPAPVIVAMDYKT